MAYNHSSLHSLVQSQGGLFSLMESSVTPFGEPSYSISHVRSGDLSQLWNSDYGFAASSSRRASLGGSGVNLQEADAEIPALAEGLERYCTTTYLNAQLLWATRNELGDEAIDLELIARASETELADPKCPLSRPSNSARIRWVEGTCMLTGQRRYVPAILAFLYLKPLSQDERLCIQITTGCAAHRSYERALLGGLLEVVERDSLSIVWLQKLSLPRIELDSIPATLKPYWNRYLHSSTQLEYYFFDATTELGIPTVYGLQFSKIEPRLRTIVCCASALQPVDAVIKVMRDMASARRFIAHAREPSGEIKEFKELSDGAVYMARAEQAEAFDFLMHTKSRTTLEHMTAYPDDQPASTLRYILADLAARGMRVIAVDLSSDEALRVGLRVVRVIIPELQPFSFNYRARYLGHPRLYRAPGAMGYHCHSEPDLNVWPQPFA